MQTVSRSVVHMDAPVVVSMADVGEKRWGYHQFVTLSEYPGNRILLRFHAGDDAVAAYGSPAPTYISEDQGQTWAPFQDDGLPPSGMCTVGLDGEFICLPSVKALDIEGLPMPEPVGGFHSYVANVFYRLDHCPDVVQNFMRDMHTMRWVPQVGTWQEETMTYDIRDGLAWARASGAEQHMVSRGWFERPLLRVGDALFYADYRSCYLAPDGSVPKNMGVSCLVSQDNGQSFTRRSTIALDLTGEDALTEPMLAENTLGELVCIIRRADHKQKSMVITFSKDQGMTWEPPTPLFDFGVYPCLLRMGNLLVMSFGRPGVHVSVSLDGVGRTWTDPVCVLPGDSQKLSTQTDGYTSMLRLNDQEVLLAYTDFDCLDDAGNKRKAVLVRKLTIARGEQ